jgi:hypothetical protein
VLLLRLERVLQGSVEEDGVFFACEARGEVTRAKPRMPHDVQDNSPLLLVDALATRKPDTNGRLRPRRLIPFGERGANLAQEVLPDSDGIRRGDFGFALPDREGVSPRSRSLPHRPPVVFAVLP